MRIEKHLASRPKGASANNPLGTVCTGGHRPPNPLRRAKQTKTGLNGAQRAYGPLFLCTNLGMLETAARKPVGLRSARFLCVCDIK